MRSLERLVANAREDERFMAAAATIVATDKLPQLLDAIAGYYSLFTSNEDVEAVLEELKTRSGLPAQIAVVLGVKSYLSKSLIGLLQEHYRNYGE